MKSEKFLENITIIFVVNYLTHIFYHMKITSLTDLNFVTWLSVLCLFLMLVEEVVTDMVVYEKD